MKTLAALLFAGMVPLVLTGQSTQGLITGVVRNRSTRAGIPRSFVFYCRIAGDGTIEGRGSTQSDDKGYYAFPSLSPGQYRLHAQAEAATAAANENECFPEPSANPEFQAQEKQDLTLSVAARMDVDFDLRPAQEVSDPKAANYLTPRNMVVRYFGADDRKMSSITVDTGPASQQSAGSTVSYVVDRDSLDLLPLAGHDTYSLVATLPGVSSDNGNGRGLGVSVSGQRPLSSNFLLDGVENNNALVTGPLNPVAPEAIEEYRVSTNNYSAEYGRTAGYIANAVTRAGGNGYHGVVYEYLRNTALNATDFADNVAGLGRQPDKGNEFGYQAGGPILKNRLFFSSALEKRISDTAQAPATYELLSSSFLPDFNVPTTRLASQLLTQYPGPVVNTPNGALTGLIQLVYAPNGKVSGAVRQIVAPFVVNRLIALERVDYKPTSGRDSLMARVNIVRLNEPDFIWSPYTAFNSALNQNTTGAVGTWTRSWTPRLTSEAKISYSDDDLWFNRAHPEIPTLLTNLDPVTGLPVTLPGSPALYSYRDHNRSLEALYSAVWTRNKHIVTAGAGVLARFESGYLTFGQDGEYIFSNVYAFAEDSPSYLSAAINRLNPAPTQPDYNRSYAYTQSNFFIQDSWRVASRLTLNFGLRYERFGAPENTGAVKDALLTLGTGSNFNQRLASATLGVPQGSGNEPLFGTDNGDFAPRFGFSWDPFGRGTTVLRGGFGLFYDRPFDNVWQNVGSNDLALVQYSVPPNSPFNYLAPIASVLPSFASQTPNALMDSNFPGITLVDPKLRNGYSESFFLGVRHAIGESLTIEVNGTAAEGRRLLTTDIVNREFTSATSINGRENDSLTDVYWSSSQGTSSYTALTSLVRWHFRSLLVQGSYTWSHSIDEQSDPLAGNPFNLNDFGSLNASTVLEGHYTPGGVSSFAQQFNSQGDRGDSDFDERHNLTLLGTWQSSRREFLARGWQFSWLAAFRSGFPYSVFSPNESVTYGSGEIENQRADLNSPSAAFLPTPQAEPGGIRVLNSAAFSIPTGANVGNTGRNAFRGPGLYNADVSLARTFALPKLREGARLTVRADAFNVLNHANLNNPDNLLGSPTFGLETYGRYSTSGFPVSVPLIEPARTIQLSVKLQF